MTDTILRQATQSEIDALNTGRSFAGQSRTQVFGANPNEKTYFVGFDGTRNNASNPSLGPPTNVALLFNQADQALVARGTTW